LDYLDLYSDLNTEPDIDNELDINAHSNLKLGLKNLGLDSKAKEILKDITELRNKGPVKLNYTSYTKKLWKREGEL
jgi:Holliday junction resolvasome RuvABC ATP-dependent DNA helicase subunit